MKFLRTRLQTLEYALPEESLSSEQIEEQLEPTYKRLRLPNGRLELMTGIKERRLWPKGTLPSDASALAGKKVLESSGANADDIDLMIHCAVSRDFLEPATASVVHKKIGLGSHTQVMDISNACLGFLNSMVVAAGMIDGGIIKRALILAGENGRPLVERTLAMLADPTMTRKSIKPLIASLTIGCGAVGALMCHEDIHDGPKLLGGAVGAATQYSDLCEGDSASGNSLEMNTNSEELLVQGVNLAKNTFGKFKHNLAWQADTPEQYITHQVGQAHRRELFSALDLDLKKDHSTFESLGNIGSVSLPLTLAKAREHKRIQSGDKVALLGIGSGINCMMLGMEWT
ncbi:MAG: 3-oxoacyl-ACP synthase III [Planctomycetes bacterium]|nr:3-oxoacyl-ACP synthase III [Planctomycetota bacterium]